MSMSEPFLPHSPRDDRTAAAEPGGEGAPLPQSTEEPDVVSPDQGRSPTAQEEQDEPTIDVTDREDPPFRTPRPADSVDADELRSDLQD